MTCIWDAQRRGQKIKDSTLDMSILKHVKKELHNTVLLGCKKSYCTFILWNGMCVWMASSVLPSDLIGGGVLEIKPDKLIRDVKETNIKKVQFATCENFILLYFIQPIFDS